MFESDEEDENLVSETNYIYNYNYNQGAQNTSLIAIKFYKAAPSGGRVPLADLRLLTIKIVT